MAILTAQSNKKRISFTLIRTLIAFFVIIGLKTYEIIRFYDANTGLLNETPLKYGLTAISYLLIGYIAVEFILFVLWMNKNVGYIELEQNPIMGLALVISGFCFMLQGIMSILPHIFADRIEVILILTDILCLLSAVAYFVKGMSIILGNNKQYMVINIIPVLWSMLVLLQVILTYPITISVQTNFSKVATAAFLVLFMYYNFRCNCGYEKEFKSSVSLFVRLSFCFIMGAWNLPYCLAYLFGVRDDVLNIPYIALIGLFLYGFIILIQHMSFATSKTKNGNDIR